MCINPLFDLLNLPKDKMDLAKQLAYIKGRDEYSQFEGDEICKLLSLTNEQYDIAKQYLVIDNFDEQIDADTLCCIAKMNPEDRMKLDDVLKQGNSDITFRALPGGKLEIVYNGEDGSIKTVQIPSNIEENYKVDGNNIYDEHIKYDENGNIVEITRIQPSDIEGYDNITVEKDGKVYELQKAYRDETTGEIVVVQNMVSPNGTTTKSEYRRKDDGSYTMKYTITDSNGNVILERNQSFTRVSDTKTLTQIDGKTYTAEFFDDHFIITDSDNNKYSLDLKSLLTNKYTQYCYINDEEGKKIIDMLKNVSADKLITLTKEGFYVTPSLNSTADNDYGINLDWNDELNDMTSIFLHEMGHYLDSENEEYTVVCENASVQEVFNKELEAFNANTSGNWQYILSHIVADLRTELVAEANMIINGYKRTDELRLRAILYQQYFPETIASISKLLDNRIEAKIDQYRDQQTNYYANNNNTENNNEDLAQNDTTKPSVEPENPKDPFGPDLFTQPNLPPVTPKRPNDPGVTDRPGRNDWQNNPTFPPLPRDFGGTNNNGDINDNSGSDDNSDRGKSTNHTPDDHSGKPSNDTPNTSGGEINNGNNENNKNNDENGSVNNNDNGNNGDNNNGSMPFGPGHPDYDALYGDLGSDLGTDLGGINDNIFGDDTVTQTKTLTGDQLRNYYGSLTNMYTELRSSLKYSNSELANMIQNDLNNRNDGWTYSVTQNADGTFTVTRSGSTETWLNSIANNSSHDLASLDGVPTAGADGNAFGDWSFGNSGFNTVYYQGLADWANAGGNTDLGKALQDWINGGCQGNFYWNAPNSSTNSGSSSGGGGGGSSSCDSDSILYNSDGDIDWKNVGLDTHDLLRAGGGDSAIDEYDHDPEEEL